MASTSAGAVVAGAAAPDPLVHVAFNQHGTHFVAATATGFHVFSCHRLERVMHRCGPAVASPGRTVTSAELLTRSQLAVVTRGADSGVDDNDTIDFWNGLCKEGKVASVTSPHGAVGGIRLQGEYMLVAGAEKARLCFGGSREKDVTTGPNPLGLCAMAAGAATEGQAGTGSSSSLVSYALPRKSVGEVQVRRRRRPGSVDVRAHGSAVACIALSHDGRMLATAGTRGTLVRVFSTADGSKLQEVCIAT